MRKRILHSIKNSFRENLVIAKAFVLSSLALLYACSGGSGEETVSETPEAEPTVLYASAVIYDNEPPAASQDILNFQRFFWQPLAQENRCGACHTDSGPGPTAFVRRDDINVAYAEALTVVDLVNPANSTVVQRVANGHSCWLGDDSVCADDIERYINEWIAGESTSSNTIQLTAPLIRDPSGSKPFPASSVGFSAIHQLLVDHCADCHSDTSPLQQRQTPYFASADIDVAYENAQTKIDLNNPADSRLVVRLRDEFHNCWLNLTCADDATTMQTAIEQFAVGIPTVNVDPSLVISKALTLLGDGIAVASGGRIETNVIALYEFKSGTGNTAYDTSGVIPAMDLTLSGDFDWIGAWGIQLSDGKAQASVNSSRKLYDRLRASNQYSIEAWIAPANVTQEGPARIITYSGGNTSRNFTLGQTLYNYDFLQRSSVTDANGMPMLSTADADEDLQAALQHVVITFDPIDPDGPGGPQAAPGRRIYVNGQFTDDVDTAGIGNLNNWDSSFAFALGNEVSNAFQWQGALRLVAIHDRALSAADIQTNYDVGVGAKYYLLFSISHLVSTPDSYIVFEVSQYDNYSYLFNAPFYISLDPNATAGNVPQASIPLRGMRLGINGKIVDVGQAFVNVDMTLDAAQYDLVNGQSISTLGTTIATEVDAAQDEFFLIFDQLGSNTNVIVEADPSPPTFVGTGNLVADIAVRNFSEISASFAAVTGIDPADSGNTVNTVYDTVIRQLPVSEDMTAFLSSHQMGVTQLAIAYCDALIDDTTARTALFPLFDPNADANAISDADWDNQFIYPMVDAALNTGLGVQPDRDDVRAELQALLNSTADVKPIGAPDGVPDGLARCGGPCAAGRAAVAAKAACAAVLGSAAVTMQ